MAPSTTTLKSGPITRAQIALPELSTLEKNLSALGAVSGAAATRIAAASPRGDIAFAPTPSGRLTATLTQWGLTAPITRALASKRDPVQEAARLTEKIDPVATPLVVVAGFGLGYHVEAIARKLGRHGVVVVFEPDLELLRTVFDQIDHSEWISTTNLIFLTDPDDEGAMADALRGLEGVIAMGVHVLEHPASQPRLADPSGLGPGSAARFIQRFTRIVQAARTTVITTMVQTEGTLRNVTQNLDLYATCPGITDLAGIAAGSPAIVVSAGPSLKRNIDLLSRPGVRDRFVIIAVQTVLKQLLAKGIRPHFVTALDFHQISKRFYEGLTEEDVRGITLVVEPKVNPAVPLAFPGTVRCVSEQYLDRLLGPDMVRPMGSLPPGATVAHLAYYLARHMACDPVVLIGQDLGFTDGQYYSAGAAIHDIWAGELNEFNTLEMLEWQRIVRMRGLIRRETDQLGRSIYTDDQMSTYLVQFQRDFKTDVDRGLTIIDATEGGVAKNHTVARRLAEVIDEHLAAPESRSVIIPHIQPPGANARRSTLSKVTQRVRTVRTDIWQVGKLCRQARSLLEEMLENHADQPRVNRLIDQVERVRDQVSKLEPAFGLVQMLNQTGAFNRQKTDRRIFLGKSAGNLTAMEVQREQIQRDLINVVWLGDSATAMGEMLDECAGACEGEPKRTRDPARPDEGITAGQRSAAQALAGAAATVCAVVTLDPAASGLGVARDLGAPVLGSMNALQLTLQRLANCRKLSCVTVVAADPSAAQRLIGRPPAGIDLRIIGMRPDEALWPAPIARAARLWSADCWRGGLGNLTCYDEALWPASALEALVQANTDAGLIVSADWGLIDPGLCDALIERYQEMPGAHRITFTQAAPGLCGCILDRTMLEQIAQRRSSVGSFASIGGILGYVPTAPVSDLIVKPMCLGVEPALRDMLHRCTLDHPARAAAIGQVFAAAGLDPLTASAAQIATALTRWWSDPSRDRPRHITLRLCSDASKSPADVASVLRQLGPWAALSTLTLAGTDGADALDQPNWRQMATAARQSGIGAVQLRTALRCEESTITDIIAAGIEVIGVDLIADDPATYHALTGRDDFGRVRANLQRLLAARPAPGHAGVTTPWIVPRLIRRDAIYEQIEPFYDYWTLMTGSAVLDPLPSPISGDRIEPLPLPKLAALRRSLTHVAL